MSNPSTSHHRFNSAFWLGAMCLVVSSPAWGQSSPANPAPADPQQSAYRDSIAQEELKKQADTVQLEIRRLIKALEENGMDAPSIARLNVISANLAQLSSADMQKVIVILQNASINPDQLSRQQGLVDAFNGQKNLSAQFKDLATQLSAQQEGDQIPTELEALIIRQSANIRQTNGLGDAAPDRLTKDQSAIHEVVSSEQQAIGNEVTSLSHSLSAVASDPKSPAGQMAQALMDYMSHSLVLDATRAATTLTQAAPFRDAVAKQKGVLNYFADMLAIALSKQSAVDQLARAKAQLDQVAGDQKALNDATSGRKLDPGTLALRQNDLNDRAELARDLIKPVRPAAAQPIGDAQTKMDTAAAQLQASGDLATTMSSQQEALQLLVKAAKDLETELAAIQAKQNQSPTEKQADLQKLQDALTQAKQTAQTNPKTAAQQLQQLQQDALPQNPAAAQNLADAANKLSNPTPDADQAQKDIDAAKAQLQQQQDALAQDAKDFQAMKDANDALEQAKQNAEAADADLKGDPAKSLTNAAKQLNDAQNQASQAAQSSSSATPDSAKQAAQQAADALKNSMNQTVQSDRNGAHQSAQQALQKIQDAQSALAQSMSNLQQKSSQSMMALGQQSPRQPSNPMAPPSTQPPTGNSGTMAGGGPNSTSGSALVMGTLSKKDREALTQFQSQKTPPEYATQVQQYLQNLANYGTKN